MIGGSGSGSESVPLTNRSGSGTLFLEQEYVPASLFACRLLNFAGLYWENLVITGTIRIKLPCFSDVVVLYMFAVVL